MLVFNQTAYLFKDNQCIEHEYNNTFATKGLENLIRIRTAKLSSSVARY